MSTPANHAIQTIRMGDFVRMELPPIEAELSFRSAQRNSRLGAYLVLVVCFLIALFPVLTAMDAWARLNRMMPLNNLAVVLLAVGLGLRELVVWACVLSSIAGVSLLFLAKRADVTIGGENVLLHRRRGPFRRTKKIAATDVRSIYLLPPSVTSEEQLGRPLDDRPAFVWVSCTGDRLLRVGYEYPHALALSIVDAISSQMAALEIPISATSRMRADAACKITALDTLNPAFLNADLSEAPEGCNARAELVGELQHITFAREPIKPATLLKYPDLRCGFWAVGLGVLAYFGLKWLSRAVAIPPQMAVVMLVASGGPGLLIIAAAMYGRLATESFCITPLNLEKTYHCVICRITRRWPRERIAAIRLAHRITDGRWRFVLEMLQTDGTRVELLSGGVLALRYVATLLRRYIGVPAARPDGYAGDPTEHPWHLTEAPEPPSACRLRYAALEDRSVIAQPPKGFDRSAKKCFALWSIFIAGGILLPILVLPGAVAQDRGAIIGSALFFGGMGLLGMLVTFWEAIDHYVFVVASDSLTITRKTLFGTRVSHFTRDKLAAIGTESTFTENPKSSVKLVITLRDGKITKPFTSSADSTRYLATFLRKALALPPEVPPAAVTQTDRGTGITDRSAELPPE
jgi:hypothetical protein